MAKQGFISWSGEESRQIAEQLQKLFGHVLAAPQMFVASIDLRAGDVWFTEIANKLEASDVGVIVVTPQNVTKPWLHFEAGAIAKRVGRSAAIPLLCGVSPGDLSSTPLAQLQAISTSESDMRDLCARLNELLELGLSETYLNESFPVWWGKLSPGIDNPEIWKGSAKAKPAPTTADLSVQITQISAALSELSEVVRTRIAPPTIISAIEEAKRRNTLAHALEKWAGPDDLERSARLTRVLDGGPVPTDDDLINVAKALRRRGPPRRFFDDPNAPEEPDRDS